MKISQELWVLELPMSFGGIERILNVSAIGDQYHGITLVDTGLPGQADLIQSKLWEEGFAIDEVRQIFLTHQDIDHVGSLNDLKHRTNATVYAFHDEIPYIDGTLPLIKMPPPERLAEMPEFAAVLANFKPTPVDVSVLNDTVLDRSSGAIVIATPGHTPGHVCLYLPHTKTLISGDALTSEDGKLSGPPAGATPDVELAMKSIERLLDYDIETIVCYHGGLVTEDVRNQIKRVVGLL